MLQDEENQLESLLPDEDSNDDVPERNDADENLKEDYTDKNSEKVKADENLKDDDDDVSEEDDVGGDEEVIDQEEVNESDILKFNGYTGRTLKYLKD